MHNNHSLLALLSLIIIIDCLPLKWLLRRKNEFTFLLHEKNIFFYITSIFLKKYYFKFKLEFFFLPVPFKVKLELTSGFTSILPNSVRFQTSHATATVLPDPRAHLSANVARPRSNSPSGPLFATDGGRPHLLPPPLR
jgi:hypothetical protein